MHITLTNNRAKLRVEIGSNFRWGLYLAASYI